MPENDDNFLHSPDSPSADPMSLERLQPDPMLDMSGHRIGSWGYSVVVLAIVIIVAVVFYGLNDRSFGSIPVHTVSTTQ